jgi:hypothetical protein
MLFVIRMLHIGWRVQAKRDWASFPNGWAILRLSANGIIWKHLLEKKVRVGLRFGARLALPSPAHISFGACCPSWLVSFSEYCLPASLNPTRAKFVQRESGSLILQPRRKRSIVVIDPPICIPSTPPFVDSEAVRQGYSHTRGMGVSRISRFSGAASRPDREVKFFGLSAQTSAKCLAGVLLTQFAT